MSSANVCHPVAHRFIDRFLQGGLASRHRHDGSAQEFHPGHIQSLPFHVYSTHVNDTLAAEPRSNGGSGYAMLSGAGFGNDPLFSHSASQQDLPERVVYLVSARMQQVLALQINFGAAKLRRQAFGEVKGSRSPGKVTEQIRQFLVKFRVLFGPVVLGRQFIQC